MNLQSIIHYFLHFGFPVILALVFFKKDWKKVSIILLATMLVDLDHLLATPIFASNRCSIGFHPLHTIYAIAVYFIMLFLRRPFNIIGIGLLLHMVTDFIDCLFMYNKCNSCLESSPIIDVLKSVSSLF